MQPDKFTIKTQAALQVSQALARERSHQEIDGEHLLVALIKQEDSLIPPLLQKLGVNLQQLTADLERELDRRVKVSGSAARDVFLSTHLKRAFDTAEQEAQRMKDEYVSTEHLLLGLLAEAGPNLRAFFKPTKFVGRTS